MSLYLVQSLKNGRKCKSRCVNSCLSLKPIFHQNAKYLASGAGVGPCTRRQIFALPNAKYTNMLVYFALADANFLRRPCTFHFFCVDFFALGNKRKPNSQWNIGGVGCLALAMYISCIFHVVCASFSALATRKLADAEANSSGIWA